MIRNVFYLILHSYLYFKNTFPELRILRIDSDSVRQPGHPAYGCMNNLDHVLSNFDLVLASPTIETGVSIDLKGHFDDVWAIAQGIQSVDSVCQTLERLREDVPRHIWVKNNASNIRVGNGSTSIKALLRSQHKLTQANIIALSQAGIDEFNDLEVDFSNESLLAWAKRACVVNGGKTSYKEEIASKLAQEGYEIMTPEESGDSDPDQTKEVVDLTRDTNHYEYCVAVSNAKTPTDKELEALQAKQVKTEQERLTERKGQLARTYQVEVSPDLVEKDDDGWYPKIQLHYYLGVGNDHLNDRDRRSLARMKEDGIGRVFKPDISKTQLSAKIKALKLLGIEQFLDPSAEFSKDNLQNWLDMCITHRFEIQSILGVGIGKRETGISLAQKLLAKLGLNLTQSRQPRENGGRVRYYSGAQIDPDGRSQIFQKWLERDALKSGGTALGNSSVFTKNEWNSSDVPNSEPLIHKACSEDKPLNTGGTPNSNSNIYNSNPCAKGSQPEIKIPGQAPFTLEQMGGEQNWFDSNEGIEALASELRILENAGDLQNLALST